MEKVNSYDFGGKELQVSEVINDTLLGTIQGLNRDLGTPNDPYYNELKSFIDEVNDAELVLIDPNILARSSYDDMDLSGLSSNIPDYNPTLLQFVSTLQDIFKGDTTQFTTTESIGGTEYSFGDDYFCLTDSM